MKTLKTITTIIGLILTGAALADANTDRLNELANERLTNAFQDSVVIDAIVAQNERHRSLAQDDVDRLDKQWRVEAKVGSGPMINTMLATTLSTHLKSIKESAQGLYTEIFVMDNKGMNVGQSDITSDYWQGDEAKWRKTYLKGAGAVFVDEVELDESTQTLQSQISIALTDPATKTVVGAVTIGVNVEALD